MYLLEILGLLGASVMLVTGTHRLLVRGNFWRLWHKWFVVCICAGVGVGIVFLGIRRTYSPTARGWGVPFVIAGGEYFEGRWHDGGVSRYLYLALLADIGCGISLCLLPLLIAALRPGRWQRGTNRAKLD